MPIVLIVEDVQLFALHHGVALRHHDVASEHGSLVLVTHLKRSRLNLNRLVLVRGKPLQRVRHAGFL